MRPRISSALVFCIHAHFVGAAIAQTSSSDQVIVGEKLDPSTYLPGIVESMEQVQAREAANPPVQKVKTRDGRHGSWVVPSPRATGPTGSGSHYIVNNWGDTSM